ncbi:MAG: Zn-dependent membrane protease YugP [Verrucomicrobiales bacterium]|jgi:Zn-dependent membrane protease YugP
MSFTFLAQHVGGYGDIGYFVVLGITMLISALVSGRLKSKFAQYSREPISLSGRQVAERMLADHGINDVRVISTPGQLTDHYNPANKTVNLSESVYSMNSVAAAAVSAHECGHAVQHAKAYAWLTMRSKLVPVVNVASKMMNVLFMVAIAAYMFNVGGIFLWLFVGCLAVTTLFAFVTLPVEFDASNRALAWLDNSGSLGSSIGHARAKDALFWAAMTYVVAAISSLAMLLYYLMKLLGNRRG